MNGVSAVGVPFAQLTSRLTAHKGHLAYTHLRLIKVAVRALAISSCGPFGEPFYFSHALLNLARTT